MKNKLMILAIAALTTGAMVCASEPTSKEKVAAARVCISNVIEPVVGTIAIFDCNSKKNSNDQIECLREEYFRALRIYDAILINKKEVLNKEEIEKFGTDLEACVKGLSHAEAAAIYNK